jgi:hypothetical protein
MAARASLPRSTLHMRIEGLEVVAREALPADTTPHHLADNRLDDWSFFQLFCFLRDLRFKRRAWVIHVSL